MALPSFTGHPFGTCSHFPSTPLHPATRSGKGPLNRLWKHYPTMSSAGFLGAKVWLFFVLKQDFSIHGTGRNYLHLPYFTIKNQANVGKYTIQGWYGNGLHPPNLKKGIFSIGKYIFQPLIFRGHVIFLGGRFSFSWPIPVRIPFVPSFTWARVSNQQLI